MANWSDSAPNDLPRWCTRLLSELEASDEQANALAKTLGQRDFDWRPHSGAWSIGQCLEHLSVGNELYCRAMSQSLAGHNAAVVQEIRGGWFGRWFIRSYIEPSPRMKRLRAPKKITPGEQVDVSILERFL